MAEAQTTSAPPHAPAVANVIIATRDETQLTQNLGAVGWTLDPAHIAALDAASETTLAYPYWHQRIRRTQQPEADVGSEPRFSRRVKV